MTTIERSTWATKVGLARMLAGGVIMDVVTADQARIAEEAGAVAVMALERVPSDIRKFGGVARMSDPQLINEIKAAVSIPVMAKCRIGHFAEAQILECARGRLHRRVRGADAGRRGAPHRQAQLQGAVRVRLPRPGRGPAAHRRGGGHDPHQGRGRNRRHRRGGAPHARRPEGHPPAPDHAQRRAVRRRQGAPRPVRRREADGGAGRAARAELQRRAAWRRRPMRASCASSAPRPSSSAAASSRARIPSATPRAIVKAATHYDNPEILAEVSAGLGEPMRGDVARRDPARGAPRQPRLVGARP